jgi:hypothetical protein
MDDRDIAGRWGLLVVPAGCCFDAPVAAESSPSGQAERSEPGLSLVAPRAGSAGVTIEADDLVLGDLERPHRAQVSALPEPQRVMPGLHGHLDHLFGRDGTDRNAVDGDGPWLVRASVVALGVGVLLLPVPFLALGGLTPTVSTQSLNSLYPWPSPGAVLNPSAPVDQAFTAQVAEVAAERQRALAQQTEPQPFTWILVIGAGIALVFVLPLLGRRESAAPREPASTIQRAQPRRSC